MGAPFRSGAAVPVDAASCALAKARIRLLGAEQHLDALVLRLRAGHVKLAPRQNDDAVLREACTAIFAARQALDEARFDVLGVDGDAWEAAGHRGLPTPNDEDDVGTVLHGASEANWQRLVSADDVPGELSFHEDARATYRAGAGY